MKQYITFLWININYYYSILKCTPNIRNHCKEETNIVIFKYHRETFSRYSFIYILHISNSCLPFPKGDQFRIPNAEPQRSPCIKETYRGATGLTQPSPPGKMEQTLPKLPLMYRHLCLCWWQWAHSVLRSCSGFSGSKTPLLFILQASNLSQVVVTAIVCSYLAESHSF